MTNDAYTMKRNDLIPEAVRYTDTVMKDSKPDEANQKEYKKWSLKWDRIYLSKMNYLARVHNLIT